MGWYFISGLCYSGTAKDTPAVSRIKLPSGAVRSILLNLQATTSERQMGIRLSTPKAAIFPKTAEGSEEWFYHQSGTNIQLEIKEEIDLGEVAPVEIILEAFNTDSTLRYFQVGIYIDGWVTEAERAVLRVARVLDFINREITRPDIEKQLRRLWEILQNIMKGGEQDV